MNMAKDQIDANQNVGRDEYCALRNAGTETIPRAKNLTIFQHEFKYLQISRLCTVVQRRVPFDTFPIDFGFQTQEEFDDVEVTL